MMRTYRQLGTILTLIFSILIQGCDEAKPVVRVGVIYSFTGKMAEYEKPLLDALTLAIEEINAKGGVIGRKVVPVIVDGKSDWKTFAQEAERLIVEEGVSALFACGNSACRKAIKPVVEKYQNLLFYPIQYEGMEQSPNIIYTGSTPNQQITPSVIWSLKNLGKSYYLIGSNCIYSRAVNLIIKDLLMSQQGEILGEKYIPLGSVEMGTVFDEIVELQPDVILNTMCDASNNAFFEKLKTINSPPIISYGIAGLDIVNVNTELMVGHYAAWNYYQSIDSDENQRFISEFKLRFGEQRKINDRMEANYVGFRLWANAVEHAKSTSALRVKSVIGTESFNAPEGIVAVDQATQHLWKTARIGRFRKDGVIDVVWQSERPIRPVPYLSYRSKKEWQQLVDNLPLNEAVQ